MSRFDRYRSWLYVSASALLCATSLFIPQPAKAAYITGCYKISCFEVFTGSKNYTNHTQLVQHINVMSMGGSGFIEAWGDGFYRSTNGNSASWDINVWARSGTYVCGAVTVPNVPRRVACMAIKV